MDRDEQKYFDEQIKQYQKQLLTSIAEDCLKLFKSALEESVYNSYKPSWYDRTRQLIDNAVYKIENDVLYIFINTDEMTYHSYINFQDTGKEVAPILPYLVEVGHMGKSTDETSNQYNDYEPRYYLEKAKMLIDRKYKIDVQIINDKPPMM